MDYDYLHQESIVICHAQKTIYPFLGLRWSFLSWPLLYPYLPWHLLWYRYYENWWLFRSDLFIAQTLICISCPFHRCIQSRILLVGTFAMAGIIIRFVVPSHMPEVSSNLVFILGNTESKQKMQMLKLTILCSECPQVGSCLF